MYCTKCGTKNLDDANFCSECGYNMVKDISAETNKNIKRSIPKGIIILIILYISLFLLYISLFLLLILDFTEYWVFLITTPIIIYGLWHGNKRIYTLYRLFLIGQIILVLIVSILTWSWDEYLIPALAGNLTIYRYLEKPNVKGYFGIEGYTYKTGKYDDIELTIELGKTIFNKGEEIITIITLKNDSNKIISTKNDNIFDIEIHSLDGSLIKIIKKTKWFLLSKIANLSPGKSLTMDVKWRPDVLPGTYNLIGYLATEIRYKDSDAYLLKNTLMTEPIMITIKK